MPNALLVYPEFPPSYWSEKYAIEFVDKKAALPPLGLLTMAACFPENYCLRLVDMNVESLLEADLDWCDQVYISAMLVQRDSFKKVVQRCNSKAKPVIVGGPFPTSYCDEIEGVQHFILGEAETIFPCFLKDLENGQAAKFYRLPHDENGNPVRPDIKNTPLPRYDLIDIGNYASMALQYSRGCPHDCEFCDITKLYGKYPRTKSIDQMLSELQLLYDCGWEGSVFIVDDNFIGNRRDVEKLLPFVQQWQRKKKYPFTFFTEATVYLASLPELMCSMADAGFNMVFLGIETPNPRALCLANKAHNLRKSNPDYLKWAVQTIQQHGMEVSAGFIVGLDGDDEGCFEAQFNFIQRSGIPTAMVGLLTALKGTKLYERLSKEGRLLKESTGDNVSVSLNFLPQLNSAVLTEGYKKLLNSLYDPSLSNYFKRCYTLLKNWNLRSYAHRKLGMIDCKAVLRSLKRQLFSRQGGAYLKFLTKVSFRRPRMLPEAVRLAIMGYHYQRIASQQVIIDDFKIFLADEGKRLRNMMDSFAEMREKGVAEAQDYLQRSYSQIRDRYLELNEDFRELADEMLRAFDDSLRNYLKQFTEEFCVQLPHPIVG